MKEYPSQEGKGKKNMIRVLERLTEGFDPKDPELDSLDLAENIAVMKAAVVKGLASMAEAQGWKFVDLKKEVNGFKAVMDENSQAYKAFITARSDFLEFAQNVRDVISGMKKQDSNKKRSETVKRNKILVALKNASWPAKLADLLVGNLSSGVQTSVDDVKTFEDIARTTCLGPDSTWSVWTTVQKTVNDNLDPLAGLGAALRKKCRKASFEEMTWLK